MAKKVKNKKLNFWKVFENTIEAHNELGNLFMCKPYENFLNNSEDKQDRNDLKSYLQEERRCLLAVKGDFYTMSETQTIKRKQYYLFVIELYNRRSVKYLKSLRSKV